MSYEILITTVRLLQEAGSFLVRGNLISPLPSLSSMARNVLLFFSYFSVGLILCDLVCNNTFFYDAFGH